MHRILSIAVSFLALTAISFAATRPNILFFLVDDMGREDSSVVFQFDENGKPVPQKTNAIFRTPNMQKMADNGIRFTQAYAYSVCSPTRISLLTGLAAPRHKVTTWTHPVSSEIDTGSFKNELIQSADWYKVGIPPNTPLLTHALKKAGYANLFAGKAHFGPNDTPNSDPRNLGFDNNIAGYGGGGPGSYSGLKNYGKGQWHVPGLDQYHGTATHLTEAITLEMNKAITAAHEANKPFFAYMSHYAVHAPFELDQRFAANYPNLKGHDKAYATLVEGMDKSLGDMLQHLDNLGIAEETLVVFYTDNGSARMMANGHPFKGMKGHRHEGGSRVPLIISWAKPNPNNPLQQKLTIESCSHNDTIVTCYDFYPTFAEIAGAKTPSEVDGTSFAPAIQGKALKSPHQSFLVHFPHGKHNNNLFSNYRYKDWKVVYNYSSKTWELYNLKDDLGETKNLASSMPEKVQELGKRMLSELNTQQANFPTDPNTGKSILPQLP